MEESLITKIDTMSYKKFTFKSEFDKSIITLKGILEGINIDNHINIAELKGLVDWCHHNQRFSNTYPMDGIIKLLDEALEDNVLTDEEIKDILWVCDNYRFDYYDSVTQEIQELHGILHGIIADKEINDIEINNLYTWIDEHKHLATTYPYEELNSLLISILKDKIITEEERKILKAFFSEFANVPTDHKENNAKSKYIIECDSVTGICSVCPEIHFENKTFCFTGTSTRVKRSDLQHIVHSTKGIFSNSVTKKTDYLIVGADGNSSWKYACYGRKVEAAALLRREGKKILIVHENDFWDALEDLAN